MATASPDQLPLSGIKVVEFAGLAPGPMVGMILSDFGADVIRIDKVGSGINPDGLCRGKRSIALDPKNPKGYQVLRKLISQSDVVIDPFRPGVLERLKLGPEDCKVGYEGSPANERLIFARLTGFQRQGPYAHMAGHDINYIALSGILSMLGTQGGPPQPPSNLLGDFAGGSLICLMGILLALLERSRSGKGQVVEADMVTGARYVSSFLVLTSYLEHPQWGKIINNGTNEERGTAALDGGAPWYGVYATKDGGWMSVGAIEPQFYTELLKLLKANTPSSLPHPSASEQQERSTWQSLRQYFTQAFSLKARSEWEAIFIGTDACVAPVLTRDEAAVVGVTPGVSQEAVADGRTVVPTPAPRLTRTPARTVTGSVQSLIQDPDEDYEALMMSGEHTSQILKDWINVDKDQVKQLIQAGAVGSTEDDFDDVEPRAKL
ncbi:unnamed protein product [Sympodiomycopsis kandeliae]